VDLRERLGTHICGESRQARPPTSRNSHFQVAYQRILQLAYVDDLLAAIKALFVKLFEPFLATLVASLHAVSAGKAAAVEVAKSWNFTTAFDGWDKVFDKLLKGLEDKAAQVCLSTFSIEVLLRTTQDRKSRLRPSVRPAVEDSSPPSDDFSTSKFVQPRVATVKF
jgi:signal recognition particle receptor subunit alpha